MRSPDRTAKEEVAALRRVVKESTGSISRHLAWGAVELLGPREAIACCLRVGWDSKSLLVITGQRIIHVETEKRVWWNLDNIHRVEIKKRRGSGTPRKLAFVSDGERWSWTMPEKGVAARGVTVPELERALRGGPSSGRTPSG